MGQGWDKCHITAICGVTELSIQNDIVVCVLSCNVSDSNQTLVVVQLINY